MKSLCTIIVIIAAILPASCGRDARVDMDAELLALHERILASHRNDDVDGWLAMEADTVVVGSAGELLITRKAERAERRREYLGSTEFSVYRDLQPPIVRVSEDGTLGWVYAQVEIEGVQGHPPDTVSFRNVWMWIELYERRPEGWRLVGNVSSSKP